MMSFEQRSLEYREYVQNYLKEYYLQFHKEPQKPLFEAMEYSLLAGGKRLRPVFAFEFCRMCGAERILAQGHPELEGYKVHCSVLQMRLAVPAMEPPAMVFPVTEATVRRWREIYNRRMEGVDNAATLTAFDEKRIVASGGACFVHDCGRLLGIGWMEENALLCLASVEPGTGERVLRTLLTLSDGGSVSLQVASTNTRAIRLYERLGFVTVGETEKWHQIF